MRPGLRACLGQRYVALWDLGEDFFSGFGLANRQLRWRPPGPGKIENSPKLPLTAMQPEGCSYSGCPGPPDHHSATVKIKLSANLKPQDANLLPRSHPPHRTKKKEFVSTFTAILAMICMTKCTHPSTERNAQDHNSERRGHWPANTSEHHRLFSPAVPPIWQEDVC